MKYLILIVIFLTVNTNIFSQKDKLYKEKIADAEYFFLNEAYEDALNTYKELNKLYPENGKINYRIGQCFMSLPFEAGRSIPYLEKATQFISRNYNDGSYKETNTPIETLFLLGKAYHSNNYLNKAIETFNSYLDSLAITDVYNIELTKRQIAYCENALEISKHPLDIEITNIGNTINSKYEDYNPAVSADGRQLVFTRKISIRNSDSVKIKLEDEKKMILYSELNSDNNWSKPQNITSILDPKGKFETLSLSADGNILLLFKNTWEDGGPFDTKDGEIFYSRKIDGKWQTPVAFDKTINSANYESYASISPDGTKLYFSSERIDGFGGLDIYVSNKNDEGYWSEAINLGPEINTPFDEDFPNILPDGKTLYFSSEGHYNMGGFDIFVSQQSDSNSWITPINLGYPINTTSDNKFIIPTQNGKRAFYASTRHEGYLTFGESDIYQLDLVPISMVDKTEITGKILLEDGRQIDSTTKIFAVNKETKDTIYSKPIKKQTGEYSLIVEQGNYDIYYTGDNYVSQTKEISTSLTNVLNKNIIVTNISLKPTVVENQKYYVIRNIYFGLDSSHLDKNALVEIEKLYVLMNENPKLYIEITGHTDTKGNQAYNNKLSSERARKVVDYLVEKGIESTRFVSRGVGSSQLIAIDQNADGSENKLGAKYNRRVEIKVLNTDLKNIITQTEQIPDEIRFSKYNRYSIAITESKELLKENKLKKIKEKFPKIDVIKTANGYLYFFGDYQKKADALVALNQTINLGFEKAYITDYFQLNKKNLFTVTKSVVSPIKYTIQLKAVERMLIIDAFTKLEGVQHYKTADGFHRYTYKEFTNKENAETELNQVISKGFTNAFIIEVDKLKH